MDNQAIIQGKYSEPSKLVAARVQAARTIQLNRLAQSDATCNAQMNNKDLKIHCVIDNTTKAIASQAMAALGLSARGYTRILKVARTIADLEGAPQIASQHFTEAMQYRPRLKSPK